MSKTGSPSNKASSQWASNPFVWGLVGFCAAMIFCELMWVRPLRAHLDAREKSLQAWESINRQEREAIANIKTISTQELKQWVATIDEQNKRFAEIQSKIHQQEIELAGPATTYIYIASVVTCAVIGLVVFWLRDANSAAATTLENVAALAPEDMMRSLVIASLANREPITVIVNDKPTAQTLSSPPTQAALTDGDVTGEIMQFFAEKGYGFILANGASEQIWFHLTDVLVTDRQNVFRGVRVSFRRAAGKKGPKAVSVRCIM